MALQALELLQKLPAECSDLGAHLDDWGGRISIGAEIGVEGGNGGGTWDRVRAAGGRLETDAISSADDAASIAGLEAPAPDLVVTLTVRIMGRPDG